MIKMQEAEKNIHTAIKKTLISFISEEEKIDFTLEKPPETKFGDWATNVALVAFPKLKEKFLRTSPRQLAEMMIKNLQEKSELEEIVAKIDLAGPGFINFYLKKSVKIEQLAARVEENSPEIDNFNQGKSVLVEFSSPNIAKPFTIGHLRSTIIGAAIANLLETTGYRVKRDNHLGDWGTQFGKQLVALEKWGDLEEIEKSQEPIKKLVELYVRFLAEAEKNPLLDDQAREIFAKLEIGDQKYLSMWQKIIDLSMKEFNIIYDKLCVRFSENEGKGYGESFAVKLSEAIVKELKVKGLLEESQGAQIVKFAPETKLPPLIIIKKDGASIYATRDLAIDKFRLDQYGSDMKIINEVGKEQSLYFKQLYKVEEMLGWFKSGQRIHIAHGLYRFKDRKMSTRKGEVIWLNDVIEAAIKKVKELNVELTSTDAEKIALGAIKWNDLSREAINDIDFDLEQMLNLKGNSGAYMQYSAVRMRSVLQKSENETFGELPLWEWWTKTEQAQLLAKIDQSGTSWLTDEVNLLDKVMDYGKIVARASDNLAPHLLTTYLYELAQEFNNFYNEGKISGNLRRLTLTKLTEITLTSGLNILGIQIPDKM